MRVCFILMIAGLIHATGGPPEATRVTSVVRSDPRTGKLVRSVVVTPMVIAEKQTQSKVAEQRTAVPATPAGSATGVQPEPGVNQAVEQIAARHRLPAGLLHSVIKVESNYNPYAVSPKGAQGLMQLIPGTARRFGVGNAFNPVENIEGGARYLRYLLDLYGEANWALALAAYNAGEAAVAKYGGVPPYRETQNYLVLVKKQLEKSIGLRQAAPAPPPPAAVPDGPAHIQEIVETDGSVRYVSRQ